eukprot:Filipodium_phascolosomae@DN2068_c0_g1_i1.p1
MDQKSTFSSQLIPGVGCRRLMNTNSQTNSQTAFFSGSNALNFSECENSRLVSPGSSTSSNLKCRNGQVDLQNDLFQTNCHSAISGYPTSSAKPIVNNCITLKPAMTFTPFKTSSRQIPCNFAHSAEADSYIASLNTRLHSPRPNVCHPSYIHQPSSNIRRQMPPAQTRYPPSERIDYARLGERTVKVEHIRGGHVSNSIRGGQVSTAHTNRSFSVLRPAQPNSYQVGFYSGNCQKVGQRVVSVVSQSPQLNPSESLFQHSLHVHSVGPKALPPVPAVRVLPPQNSSDFKFKSVQECQEGWRVLPLHDSKGALNVSKPGSFSSCNDVRTPIAKGTIIIDPVPSVKTCLEVQDSASSESYRPGAFFQEIPESYPRAAFSKGLAAPDAVDSSVLIRNLVHASDFQHQDFPKYSAGSVDMQTINFFPEPYGPATSAGNVNVTVHGATAEVPTFKEFVSDCHSTFTLPSSPADIPPIFPSSEVIIKPLPRADVPPIDSINLFSEGSMSVSSRMDPQSVASSVVSLEQPSNDNFSNEKAVTVVSCHSDASTVCPDNAEDKQVSIKIVNPRSKSAQKARPVFKKPTVSSSARAKSSSENLAHSRTGTSGRAASADFTAREIRSRAGSVEPKNDPSRLSLRRKPTNVPARVMTHRGIQPNSCPSKNTFVSKTTKGYGKTGELPAKTKDRALKAPLADDKKNTLACQRQRTSDAPTSKRPPNRSLTPLAWVLTPTVPEIKSADFPVCESAYLAAPTEPAESECGTCRAERPPEFDMLTCARLVLALHHVLLRARYREVENVFLYLRTTSSGWKDEVEKASDLALKLPAPQMKGVGADVPLISDEYSVSVDALSSAQVKNRR